MSLLFVLKRAENVLLYDVYYDQTSTFESLLEKDKSVTIHHRNIHVLATEMYKAKNGLSPPIIRNIFPINDRSYSLRNTNYFKRRKKNYYLFIIILFIIILFI